MGYNIAIVGATGNVGHVMLSILASSSIPLSNVTAVASIRSKGIKVPFGSEKHLVVEELENFDFSKYDIALFSPGSKISSVFAPKAASQGCIVIDNTSYFRMFSDVPLIVPEVNPEAFSLYKNRNIISNPNCVIAALVMALKPLQNLSPLKRVVVATYQSVSGAGKEGTEELLMQLQQCLHVEEFSPKYFPKPIAFNVIPQIDDFLDSGYTKEEEKIIEEAQKILNTSFGVVVTCVRVPVLVGHSAAVNVEFEAPISIKEARIALEAFPGVKMCDDLTYITPLEGAHRDLVFVSRLRVDNTVPYGLSFWVVSDNLRKGAALNAVQIAEYLVEHNLLRS